MSIIYDALKKIQRTKAAGLNIPEADKKHSKYNLYVFYFLIICAGLFMGNIFFSFLGRRKSPPIKKINRPVVGEKISLPIDKPSQKKEPVESSAPEKGSEESLVINGVFFSEDEGYALINNKIVKEGDVIAEGKVQRITLDEVVLERAGVEIRLPARK